MAKDRQLIPLQGSISSSSNKKFEELVIFVHFFGGNKLQMRRHVDFVNELGFDALTFNLSFNEKTWITRIPYSKRRHEFGLRYIWGDDIERVLNSVPGPKIIYAFSNPAAAAVDATVRRKASDIKALITDSGPFVHMWKCSWNLLTYGYPVKNRALRLPATAVLAAMWGLNHSKDLHRDLLQLPKNFPVLSVRGWEDPLVPVSCIDDAFAPALEHLHYETLALPTAKHLNGLKDFPQDFKPKVAQFLEKFATRLGHKSTLTSRL